MALQQYIVRKGFSFNLPNGKGGFKRYDEGEIFAAEELTPQSHQLELVEQPATAVQGNVVEVQATK